MAHGCAQCLSCRSIALLQTEVSAEDRVGPGAVELRPDGDVGITAGKTRVVACRVESEAEAHLIRETAGDRLSLGAEAFQCGASPWALTQEAGCAVVVAEHDSNDVIRPHCARHADRGSIHQ